MGGDGELCHTLGLRLLSAEELGKDFLALGDPSRFDIGQAGVNVPQESRPLLLIGLVGANQRPHVVAGAGEVTITYPLLNVFLESLRQCDVDRGCAHAGGTCYHMNSVVYPTLFVNFPTLCVNSAFVTVPGVR